MRVCVSKADYSYSILLFCSGSWGIRFHVWSSHALDLVVTYFLDVGSVPPGPWCSLDVGLVLRIVPRLEHNLFHTNKSVPAHSATILSFDTI
jgi:hypothetical protein